MRLPLQSLAKSSALSKPFDVLIIGAGWAGLGAANLLREKNVDNFLILEGRDYIGGRSKTITLQDGLTRAELGSQWVQGAQESNPVYQAVRDSGTTYSRTSDGFSNSVWTDFDEVGSKQGSKMRQLTEAEHDQLVSDLFEGPRGFFEFQAARQNDGAKDRSLREIADQFVEKMQMTEFEQGAFEWMLDSFIAEEYAANLEDLSHWWWDADEELLGGDIYLACNSTSGFSSVVEHYAAPVAEKIHTNTRAISVDWTDRIVAVKVIAENCTATIMAKHVIVTVPLGVLKENSIQFVPSLPRDKVEAIDKIGMGNLNKCILQWDETDNLPWPKNKEWIERIAPARGVQGRWTEFFNPAPLNGRPALYAYCAGQVSKVIEETQSEAEIKNEILESLSTMFDGVPEPRQVIVSRWGIDKFSRGAYSFNQVGCSPEHRKALARQLRHRLYFAGEATSINIFATAQGALLSGRDAAKRITTRIRKRRG